MAELIKMPRLSDTMEEGTVATWFKKVGDKISEGDILAGGEDIYVAVLAGGKTFRWQF